MILSVLGKRGATSSEAPSGHEDELISPLYSLNNTYSSVPVVVDPCKLKKTEFAVRATDDSHPSITVWKRKFAGGGYGAGNSYISVAVLRMADELFTGILQNASINPHLDLHNLPETVAQQIHNYIAKNGVVYVDGMHRGVALRDEAVVTEMRKCGYKVKAHLYYRKDKMPMLDSDVVAIGGALNSQDSLSIKMSLGDRCHNASATLFALLKLSEDQWPRSSKPTYNSALQHLSNDVHFIERTPFRCIMNEHSVNCDIIGRRQRTRYDKIMRGVFRHSTNQQRARSLEKAVNRASVQLWSTGNVWDKKTFEEQLFVLYTLPELFPSSRYGNKKSARQSLSQSSATRTPSISSENVDTVVEYIVTIWDKITECVLTVLEVNPETIFEETISPGDVDPDTSIRALDEVIKILARFSTERIVNGTDTEKSKLIPEIVANLKLVLTSDSSRGPSTPQDNIFDVLSEQGQTVLHREEDSEQTVMHSAKKSIALPWKTSSEAENTQGIIEQNSTVQLQSEFLPCKKRAPARIDETTSEKICEKSVGDSNASKTDITPKRTVERGEVTKEVVRTESISAEQRRENEDMNRPSFSAEPMQWAAVKSALIESAYTNNVYLSAMKGVWEDYASVVPQQTLRSETDNVMDENRFSIVYRDNAFLSWILPTPRRSGFFDVREEEKVEPEALVRRMGKWLEGFVDVLGYRRTKFRLFEDRERTFSKLNPQFQLVESLNEQSPEYRMVALPLLHTVEWERSQVDTERIHIQRILRALGFRPPHRLFFIQFSVMDYFNIRCQLFHGIVSSNPEWFSAVRTTCDKEDDELSGESVNVLKQSISNYFMACRLQLDATGFLVLNQIFSPQENSETENWNTRPNFDSHGNLPRVVSTFFSYWVSKTPTPAQIDENQLTEEHFKLWSSIRDTNDPNEVGIGKCSRLMTTAYGVTTHLEDLEKDESGTPIILQSRCYLEVAVMQVVQCLKLQFNRWNSDTITSEQIHRHTEQHGLHAPDTGGKVLATMGLRTRRQKGHLDFIFDKSVKQCERQRVVEHVPYFAIVTSYHETPIWISEGSHKLIATTESQMRELGKRFTLSLFRIPPWSLLIVRGDVIHAGAGGKESAGMNCHRFHMYILREGVALGDTINHFVAQHMKAHRLDATEMLGRLRKL